MIVTAKQQRDADVIFMALEKRERSAVAALEFAIARKRLRKGDRVSRALCGGGRGTFVFFAWDGMWACGRSIDDCPPSAILKVNGQRVSFLSEALDEWAAEVPQRGE